MAFYDRHVDKSLILKRVEVLPSIVSSLSHGVDETLNLLKSRGTTLENVKCDEGEFIDSTEMTNAKSVGDRYKLRMAYGCNQVTSTLLLHPGHSERCSIFGKPCPKATRLVTIFFNERHTLCTFERERMIQKLLDHSDSA